MAWGGYREGAGRKPSLIERKNKTIRVSDEEYEIVKQFIKILKGDKEKAKVLLENL